MANQIIKGFGKGLKKVVEETAEKLGEEGQKILESTISGKELLGLEGGFDGNQMAHEQQEDEIKKAEEVRKIKSEMNLPGRDVEKEIEEIRRQREKEEEEKEKYFEEEKKKREMEEQQVLESNNSLTIESSNPSKQRKSRGSAFIMGKKKHKPDQASMSATAEFKGKVN
jgi:hypothetical protein